MKLILILFCWTAICGQSFAELEKEIIEEKVGLFKVLILETLIDLKGGGCNGYLLHSKTNETLNCLATTGVNHSFCDSFHNHFTNCTNILVETLESCVEPQRRGIPTALVTTVVDEMDFICNTDGEHLFELLNPCVIKTFSNDPIGAGICVENFMREIKIIHTRPQTMLPNICRAMSNARNCIKVPFESNCPNSITRNTLEELYNRNVKVCGTIQKA